LIVLFLVAVAFAGRAAAQQPEPQPVLELVVPASGAVTRAPVVLLVWRISIPVDSASWSIRAGDVDLSNFATPRGRELRVELPPELALGVGTHRLAADVCIARTRCASRELILEVMPPGTQQGSTKGNLLDVIVRVIRTLVGGSSP